MTIPDVIEHELNDVETDDLLDQMCSNDTGMSIVHDCDRVNIFKSLSLRLNLNVSVVTLSPTHSTRISWMKTVLMGKWAN